MTSGITGKVIVERCLVNFLLLTAGMLSAIWFRTEVALNLGLEDNHQASPVVVTTIILLLASCGSYGVGYALSHMTYFSRSQVLSWQFRILMMGTVIAGIIVTTAVPHVSKFQTMAFIFMTAFFGILVIVLPSRSRASAYLQMSIIDIARDLTAHRHLLLLWLKYRIEARYRQTFLGILWIVLLPVSNSLVIAFAFSQLLGARMTIGVPFVAFLLSGLVIFSIFRSIIQNSQIAILSMMALIKQVYFPREIIIFLLVGEALVDFLFMFAAMICINAIFFGIYPNLFYVLLIVPILVLTGLSMGLALALSWVSLVIRDMQQLVTVVMQLLFYMTVLYSPSRASTDYAWLVALNPLSSIVTAYRDIVLYAQAPDWVTFYFPAMLSMALLYLGYVLFKVNEDRLVDMA